jgi:hypothetical protein
MSELRDGNILALVEELEAVCRADSSRLLDSPLSHFLILCAHPDGTKKVRISTSTVISSPLLETRVGKLPDGPLFDLCKELAAWHDAAREFSHGQKLLTLLNMSIPKFPLKKRRRRDG